MKFSLIIPVYNVEKYLYECLEHCIKQDLSKEEYEIIIIIDGSPDNSIYIAENFQKKYSNIKIINNKENHGLSYSRNIGLDIAQGQYIWFIDSDDFIQRNILSELSTILTANNLDAIYLEWYNINENSKYLPLTDHLLEYDTQIHTGHCFMSKYLKTFLFAWAFIYKRSFLQKNNLYFTNNMYYEDSDFAFRTLPLLERISIYKQRSYYYRQRHSSITNKLSFNKLKDMCRNCSTAYNEYKKNDFSINQFYLNCFTSFYLKIISDIIKSDNKEFRNYLVNQTINKKWGRIPLYGNYKTKLIALIYNSFGIKACLYILRILKYLKSNRR